MLPDVACSSRRGRRCRRHGEAAHQRLDHHGADSFRDCAALRGAVPGDKSRGALGRIGKGDRRPAGGNEQHRHGLAAAVMLIWRTEGRGLVELLAEQLNFSHAEVSTQSAIVDDDALIKEVESHSSASTPISVGQAERRMQAGARIKLLVFGGIAASVKTIRNGSYPLSRPLSLVTRRLPEGAEKRFIDFALSGHVADLFAKYDFVA